MINTEDLRDSERLPHNEINEDGRRNYHWGYEIAYCEVCKRPIIHAVDKKIEPDCGRHK